MKKIMNLNQFQKLLLIVIMGSVLFTGLIYCTLNSKIGFEYQKQIFIPESQNDCTVYSGILNGKQTRFIVFDNQVVFEYGHDQVNTYTVYKDDLLITEEFKGHQYAKGYEIYKDDELKFKGTVIRTTDDGICVLYDENGSLAGFNVSYIDHNGIERDEQGNEIQTFELSLDKIIELIEGPVLVKKVQWIFWVSGLVLSIINLFSILYAEELFQFQMSFRIQNSNQAEPSELELFSRYLSWILLLGSSIYLFVSGIL